jgi:hypothetical protein
MVVGTPPFSNIFDLPNEGRKQLDEDERYIRWWMLNKVRYQLQEDTLEQLTILPDGKVRKLFEKYDPCDMEKTNDGEVLREIIDVCSGKTFTPQPRALVDGVMTIIEPAVDSDLLKPLIIPDKIHRYDEYLSTYNAQKPNSKRHLDLGNFGAGFERVGWEEEKGVLLITNPDDPDGEPLCIYTLRMFQDCGMTSNESHPSIGHGSVEGQIHMVELKRFLDCMLHGCPYHIPPHEGGIKRVYDKAISNYKRLCQEQAEL